MFKTIFRIIWLREREREMRQSAFHCFLVSLSLLSHCSLTAMSVLRVSLRCRKSAFGHFLPPIVSHVHADFQRSSRRLIVRTSTHFYPDAFAAPMSVPCARARLCISHLQASTCRFSAQLHIRLNLWLKSDQTTRGPTVLGTDTLCFKNRPTVENTETQMTAYLATKSILILKALDRIIQKGTSALTIGSRGTSGWGNHNIYYLLWCAGIHH